MKRCFKCGVDKDVSDFYKHKQMTDGHLNKCKECTKSDVKKNRGDNIEYYKSYDAWRFQNDPKVRERHKKYQSTPDGREAMRKARKIWETSNPEKRAAHVLLGNAVRSGRIDKPNKCSKCCEFTPRGILHAHHHDYAKPLDVTWLCVYCHVSEHKED